MAEDHLNPPDREDFGVRDASLGAALKDRLAAEVRHRRDHLEQAVRAAPGPAALEIIQREAHRLAGACAYCGEQRLQRAALALETAAATATAARLDTLHDRWREVAALIATIVERTGPRS